MAFAVTRRQRGGAEAGGYGLAVCEGADIAGIGPKVMPGEALRRVLNCLAGGHQGQAADR